MKTTYSILILLTIFLTGCDTKEKELLVDTYSAENNFRSITYFDKNKLLRNDRIAECNNLKNMTIIIEKDCINAKKSFAHEKHKKSRIKHIDYSKLPT
jgi:hypothetical protein